MSEHPADGRAPPAPSATAQAQRTGRDWEALDSRGVASIVFKLRAIRWEGLRRGRRLSR